MTARLQSGIWVASSNEGKLRDFAGAARVHGVVVSALPNFDATPPPDEHAPTFESNAAIKAEYYSSNAPNRLVLADDSGLCVDSLNGAPGVHSARYAALARDAVGNSSDAENNARLLHELSGVPAEERTAQFVCVIAVALDGRLQACFRGEVPGTILNEARGTGGFGYDPLFLIPELGKTFAELTAEEKSAYSHRGKAFAKFLRWFATQYGLQADSTTASTGPL